MQLNAVPLLCMNMCICTTYGAVPTFTLPPHTPPFLSKVVLNLFQTTPHQARLLTEVVRMFAADKQNFLKSVYFYFH